MRKNLLVKVEGTPIGRKTSLCQGAKEPGVFKYCIQECQGRCHVGSIGKEGKRQRAVYETIRKGATLRRLRVTLMSAFFHCLSAFPWEERLLLILAAVRPLLTLGHH